MKTMEQETKENSKAKHEVAKEATKLIKEVSDADKTMAQATGVEMKRAEKVVAQATQGQQQLRGQTQKVPSREVQKVVSSAKKSATAVSTAKAPADVVETWDATFSVNLDGKAGGKDESFTVRVHPEWAPQGAKRFKEIVQAGILKDSRFFRVVPGFMVQFGIPGTPKVAATWAKKHIPDEQVKQTNALGTLTFAKAGPNSRTSQIFINFANNRFLDKQGFAPFAEVLGDGMKVVERIQAKYKERPNQGKIQHRGNTYLMKDFPDLSFIDHVDSPVVQSSSFIQHTQDQAGAQKQTTNDVGVASENDGEVQHVKKKASRVQQVQEQVKKHQPTYLDDVDVYEDDSSSNDQSDGGDDDDGNWR
jgi:peptidyl-prolyl cis-trans isomerase A (cyclophilin A)